MTGEGTPRMRRLESDLAEGRARVDERGEVVSVRQTSWAPGDLGPALRGERRPLEPAFLPRSDGQALLYPEAPHVFFGESETLKSWAAMLAAKSFLEAGQTVLYLDFESNDVVFVRNARQVGIADGFIGQALKWTHPEEPAYVQARSGDWEPNGDAYFQLEWARQELRPSLIVVDGVTECYALHGWNINDGEDAATFNRFFGRWDGAASIAIDHAGKDASRGQIGSQHKRAGLDGASYEFTSVRREGIGGHSIATVKVKKDRYGAIRAFCPDERVGTIHVTDDGAWIDPPDEAPDVQGARVQALLVYLAQNPGRSEYAIRQALGAWARDELLEQERLGCATWERGPRNAKLWSLVGEAPVSTPV